MSRIMVSYLVKRPVIHSAYILGALTYGRFWLP